MVMLYCRTLKYCDNLKSSH
uniref:Uncharacterized protein n=1 Tax=Anguilla anguilla TaxID=7936 RepID=A0A0E9PI06_ANGAN